MKTKLRKLRIWLFLVWLSFRAIFRINVSDQVVYKGKRYTVCNGVKCYMLRLAYLDNDFDGWVPRNDCKKVWSLSNLKGSFRYNYDFYMGHWFGILTRGEGARTNG